MCVCMVQECECGVICTSVLLVSKLERVLIGLDLMEQSRKDNTLKARHYYTGESYGAIVIECLGLVVLGDGADSRCFPQCNPSKTN